MAQNSKPPTKGRRFMKLAGMTASVAGGYAQGRVKRLFLSEQAAEQDRQESMQRAGERIVRTLGELKGAAMKMGQMASMAADLLPAEMQGALQSLQKEAPPMPYEVIAEQIEAELDQPVEALFDDFEREPFAAASIGQVHRARVDGREVICKVQYPGVDEAVDSDMKHLKFVLRASGAVQVDPKSLDASFREIRARMHEELDYCIEADNVRLFRGLHAEDPFVVIPQVVGHRSSKRVLTLTYEPGDSVTELDDLGYSAEERDRCGANLWAALESQIFDHQCIHADPNPANFAFRRDGRVVMYDFGCVKRLEDLVVDGYKKLILHGLAEDYGKIDVALLELGVRKRNTPAVDAGFYKLWRDWLAVPLLGTDPFDFGTATLEREMFTKLVPATLKRMSSFGPASELVFLNRMFVGHYATLRKIRASVPIIPTLGRRVPEVTPWLPSPAGI